MDRLDAIITFVDVVNERSFAAAGRRRSLPRAVVSRHVALLEAEFGARFFHRTTRRLSLTDAGARFHQHCLTVVAALAEARADVSEQGAARGVLRMTAPAAFSERHLLDHLQSFAEHYPEVRLDLDCSEHFRDLVRDGFDVALRICVKPSEGLVAKKLARSSLLICASPEYVRRRGAPKRPEELASHDCIGYANQAHGSVWDLGAGASAQAVKIAPRHRTNDNHFLRRFAMAGHGLAQLPSYFVSDDVRAGKLVTVLDRYRDTSRSLFLVYPSGGRPSLKVRALVDHLSAVFRDERRWS